MKKIYREIIDYMGITIGCFIMAAALVIFVVPNQIAPGGFSGLGTVFYYVAGIPVGVTLLVLSIPLFIITIKFFGAHHGAKSFYGTICLSLMIDLFPFPVYQEDVFLASVFGGVVFGIGTGIALRFNGTTGGTTLMAYVFRKLFGRFSMGVWMMICDFVVILIAGMVFQEITIMLYSIITLFIIVKVVDFIQEGLYATKAFYIISDCSDEIGERIINEIDRGATVLKAQGLYTKKDKEVIMCVVGRNQITKMKNLVKQTDPGAFVILVDAHEVLGEGFSEK
jgi:uncharacterized membrane-anchored protein YitT (DUF2179 family)